MSQRFDNQITSSGSRILFAIFKNSNYEMVTLAPIIPMMEKFGLDGNKDLTERGYPAMVRVL